MSKFRKSPHRPLIDAMTIAAMSCRELQDAYTRCANAAAAASREAAHLARALRKRKRAEARA